MVDLETLALFAPIALALNLTPGADMLYCLGQGARSGPRAGIAASIGVSTGGMLHTLAAALGLAALLAAHPLAFELIRWAGVAYLAWLGLQALIAPLGALRPTDVARSSVFRAWRGGLVVNLLNPKVAIFVLALIPQFVDPTRGSALVQFLILGGVLNIGGTIVNALVGGFAGGVGAVLNRSRPAARALQAITGCIFFGLAFRLATDRR